MNCPHCSTENPEGASFCFNCGARLRRICRHCQTENPAAASFCFNCGRPVDEPLAAGTGMSAPGEPGPAPDLLMPAGLVEKLQEARRNRAMEGERRVVSLLFSDVAGSTRLSEQLDPEEWTEIMNGVFERMIGPVYQYEGNVARLMGDAILAFFGAPIAHEDDPQRAVLAGLDIVAGMRSYRETVKRRWGIDLDVRVGINTGLVVVGAVGSDLRMEYTAMGDAINLAARMEQTAEPGTVRIAEATYRQVAPLFEFSSLGAIEIKGKSTPVQVYQVLGRKARPGRLRGIQGVDAPMIGREREESRLLRIVDGLEQGSGGIVCLIGEAGLGKSRLIRELRQSVSSKQGAAGKRGPAAVQWVETASLSYETGQSYSLFRRLIRRLAGVGTEEPAESLRARLSQLVAGLRPEEQEDAGHLFESLFGLASQTGRARLEGEAFKGQMFAIMMALWRERTSQGPLILVCDDLHWSDPASAALLARLFPLAEAQPLLIICLMREEPSAPGWQAKETAERDFKAIYREIRLQALSAEDSNQLVDSLLRISDLPAGLRARILDRTQGNPFFVEEVVRSLIDEGVVVRDEGGDRWQATSDGAAIDIPANVQALLTARIDRLAESVRGTLQLASVVGRSFYYRVLSRIAASSGRLDEALLTLRQSKFIEETTRQPELAYSFRHALTQEAAYSTILLRQRRGYHQQVGKTLEALFPEQREEMAGSLAFHFFQAKEFPRALAYYIMAGDVAFRQQATVEAIDYYDQAVRCRENVADSRSETLVHLYTRRGRAYELDGQFDTALENYQRMVELAQEREDEGLRLASLTAQCIIRATMTPLQDPAQAKALAEMALALATRLGDRAAEARVLWGLLLVESRIQSNFEQALAYGQQSLAISRELGLTEQMAQTLHDLAVVYQSLNQVEAARQAIREAQAAWRELGNRSMLADSYFATATLAQATGAYESGLAAGLAAMQIGQSLGNRWTECVAHYFVGGILAEMGEIGRAYEHIERGVALAQKGGMTPLKYAGYGHLVWVLLAAGALERAEPPAEEIDQNRSQQDFFFRFYNLSRVIRLKLAQGDLRRAAQIAFEVNQGIEVEQTGINGSPILLAELALCLAQQRPEVALEKGQPLIERARQHGAKSFLSEALLLRGRALAAMGKRLQAGEALREAAAVAEEIGQRRVLWQALRALAENESVQGQDEAARATRQRARPVIDFMSDHMGNEEFRSSFLSQPEVRALLDL